MSKPDNGLKQLHQIRIRLQSVEEQLARGPRTLRARQIVVEKKQAEVDAAREQIKQLRLTADRKSLQIKTNEAKLADLRTKLNQCSSNREYEILHQQIAADEMATSVLEDDVLETLEKIDAAQRVMKIAEQELAAAQGEHEKSKVDIAAAEPTLKEMITAIQAEVVVAERVLPADVSPMYRRLVAAHGADALSAVENKACGSCHASLSGNRVIELNVGKMIFCNSCGRLMYTISTSMNSSHD